MVNHKEPYQIPTIIVVEMRQDCFLLEGSSHPEAAIEDVKPGKDLTPNNPGLFD